MFHTMVVSLSRRRRLVALLVLFILLVGVFPFSMSASASSSTTSYSLPTWWAKYQRLLKGSSASKPGSATQAFSVGANVDMSNEDTPQSETSITVNPNNPMMLVGGSNEIVRLPMRGYFSSNGGKSWGAVDVPLPPPATTNGTDFGSDPGVAFDTRGNVYYSFIVVFFNRTFAAIQGTEMAVAKSFDGGKSWPQVTFFNFNSGSGKFNDKPLIAVDTNPNSPFRDSVYVGWDTVTSGKSSANDVLLLSRSTDRGASWSAPVRVNDDPTGVRKDQFNQWLSVDPASGSINLSWNDARNDPADIKTDIFFSQSTDGGLSFAPNVKVTTAMSDESAANPCADAGNQYGDYEGIVAFRGNIHPIWTDGRFDCTIDPATGLKLGEEIFTALVTVSK